MSTVSSTPAINPYLVTYSSNDLSGSDTVAGKYTASANNKNGSSSSSGSYSQGLIGQMTGLDITNMVNESMQSDVVKLNSLLAKEQITQWTQDRYRSVITNLQNFSGKYFDQQSDDYILTGNAFSTNFATSSNKYIADATALNNAKTGIYTITSATLATVANITSATTLQNASGSKPRATDALSTLGGISDGTLSFSIGGNNISYNLKSTSSISRVMQDLSSMTGLNFNYSELTGKFSISTQSTGDGKNVDIQSINDGCGFFTKFGITQSNGAIATCNTARIDGSGQIKNGTNIASSTDLVLNTNLGLLGGNMDLAFSITGDSGSTKSYTVSISASDTIASVMSSLSSATGLNFNYNDSTGKVSIESTGNTSLNISYGAGSTSQTFLNNLFGQASGTSSISQTSASAAIESDIQGSSTAKNGSNVALGTDALSSTNLGLTNGSTISFKVNGTAKSYTIDTSKTINDFVSDFNTQTGLNLNYNASTGQFSIKATAGIDTDINYTNDTSSATYKFFGNVLGATPRGNADGSTVDLTTSTAGHNGVFTMKEPGDTFASTISEASNSFTVDGMSFSLSNSISADNPLTINVSQDVSSVVDKIKSFVTEYNNLIDGINTVVTEKRDYDYKPLNAAKEADMTDSQIKAWNEKAQQGLMQNDGNLSDLLSAMRAAFYTPVNGNGFTMADVGLSTSNDPTQGGKIIFNEKTLKSALQNNPQQVVDLFTKSSTSYKTYEETLELDTTSDPDAVNKAVAKRSSEEGIFQRLSDIEKKYAGTYIDKHGNQGILLMRAGMPNSFSESKSTLYKELQDQAKAVKDFKDKMTADAKMYNAKFTNLQTILSQLSSQQSALSSMLGNGN